MKHFIFILLGISLSVTLIFCKTKEQTKSKNIQTLADLKRGELISCGPGDQEFGKLDFDIEGDEKTRTDFNLGVKLLHSFEYDEAEKVFARIIDRDPESAMAYWGIAMSNFHPLWTPPTESELIKGAKAIEIARSLAKSPSKETDYIEATAAFFSDWQNTDHRTRTLKFEKAMQEVYNKNPQDTEAAIFYALSLDASADPADKTFANQKKAASILNPLYVKYPDHPGIVHYIIHTYDLPELASMGLEAARRYAQVAPSSAHALHMPSHIFTRLGLWKEAIHANKLSVSSAQCYAESAGMKGHWDEELHGIDYLTYAYLQLGHQDSARLQYDYLKSIKEVTPVNFKVAYAFASVPSRYVLENKLWKEAASLESNPGFIDWKKYPWQHSILLFTRALGNIQTGNLSNARLEINKLKDAHQTLLKEKDNYKANQVLIQINSAEAWLKLKEGKKEEALAQMKMAVDLESKTEKHPVTPGEVVPAMELLADMHLELKQPEEALKAYEQDLAKHPNRLNSITGAKKVRMLLN